MVIELDFHFFFIRLTIIWASEFMMVLILAFTIFWAVKRELTAADEFKLFIWLTISTFSKKGFFIIPENPVILDVLHFNQNQWRTQNIKIAYFLFLIHKLTFCKNFIRKCWIGLTTCEQYIDQNIGLSILRHEPHSDWNFCWKLSECVCANVVFEFELDQILKIFHWNVMRDLDFVLHEFMSFLTFYFAQKVSINWYKIDILIVQLNFFAIRCLLYESLDFNMIVLLEKFPNFLSCKNEILFLLKSILEYDIKMGEFAIKAGDNLGVFNNDVLIDFG